MTKSGVIVMENGDWIKFTTLMEAAIKPLHNVVQRLETEMKNLRTELKEDIKDLPCGDHTIKLTQIDTRHTDEERYRQDTKAIKNESKDFIFKALTVIISLTVGGIALLGVMYTMGVFKAIAK